MRGVFDHFFRGVREILLDRRVLLTSTRDDRDGRVGITGDAVNIGARLKALASVDEILASRETFQAVEGFFQTEALPPITMKGRDQAISLYRPPSEVPAATQLGVAELPHRPSTLPTAIPEFPLLQPPLLQPPSL